MAKKEKTIFKKVDLMKALGEKRKALRAIRFASSGSRSPNVKESRTIRHEVAAILSRLKTAE